jgi:hypothetical protein
VGVLSDLPDECAPVTIGHPVPWLDAPLGVDKVLEVPLLLIRLALAHRAPPPPRS